MLKNEAKQYEMAIVISTCVCVWKMCQKQWKMETCRCQIGDAHAHRNTNKWEVITRKSYKRALAHKWAFERSARSFNITIMLGYETSEVNLLFIYFILYENKIAKLPCFIRLGAVHAQKIVQSKCDKVLCSYRTQATALNVVSGNSIYALCIAYALIFHHLLLWCNCFVVLCAMNTAFKIYWFNNFTFERYWALKSLFRFVLSNERKEKMKSRHESEQ